MKKSRYYLILLLLFICNPSLWSNPQGAPNFKEMNEKKWEFMEKTANLSPEETKTVKPIFMAYEEKIWKLHEQNRLYRKKKDNNPNYEELNNKYIELETRQAEYLKEYHQKLQTLLPPEKLFNYYRAERSYKRKLIQEMQENRLKHHREKESQKK